MELLSVIVPVYGVEAYLDRCVASIAEQTYANLEIILVDDGSPDACPAMCDAWAHRDSRIRVIHQKNGGLSAARNVGMEAATGTLIGFVDGDDFLHRQCYELLYQAMCRDGAELAACDIQTVFDADAVPDGAVHCHCTAFSSEQAMKTLLRGETFRAVVWNKLYRRELLANARFPVGRSHEDEFFTYRVIARPRRLTFVAEPLYYYVQREGSIMRTASAGHLDVLDAHIERLHFLQTEYPQLHTADKVTFCRICVALERDILRGRSGDMAALEQRIRSCRCRVSFHPRELCRLSARELFYVLGSRCALGATGRLLNRIRG